MKYYASIGDDDYEIYLEEKQNSLWVRIGDRLIEADWVTGDQAAGFYNLILNGVSFDITAERLNDAVYVTVEGEGFAVQVEDERTHHVRSVSGHDAAAHGGTIRSVMPGMIMKVLVKEGDAVDVETPLAIMEAMKMENEIRSQYVGVVQKVCVSEGASVNTGEDLFVIAPAEAE